MDESQEDFKAGLVTMLELARRQGKPSPPPLSHAENFDIRRG